MIDDDAIWPPLPSGPTSPAAWQLLRYSHSPLPFLEACARRYGDPFTVRWAGYGRYVMLASPDAVRDVFRGDSQVLHSGEGNEFLISTVGENSVLVLDDEPHARQRRVLLPPFKGERMRSFFDTMQAATLEAVSSWSAGRTLRMIEPMQQITLQVMLQVVLGLRSRAELAKFAGKVQRVLELGRRLVPQERSRRQRDRNAAPRCLLRVPAKALQTGTFGYSELTDMTTHRRRRPSTYRSKQAPRARRHSDDRRRSDAEYFVNPDSAGEDAASR